MLIPITESGMEFGPFDEKNLFYIEKSKVYMKLQNSFKIAEFLLYQPEKNKLIVLEAKTTAPSPKSTLAESEEEIQERKYNFDNFITEIYDKLLNALTLGVNLCIERYERDELPYNMQSMNLSNIDISLVLVIKNHKFDWIQNVQYDLQKRLRSAMKAWNCRVTVLNEELARANGLIQ